jgi:hypothetical protein
MLRIVSVAVVLGAPLLAAATAHAQLLNTWVSATGSDSNPCSRALPCATFRGAILKTDAGGQISVVDSGEYGTVDITKSITIDGGGSLASIGTTSPGPSSVVVNAGPNDRVVLRNLSFARSLGFHTGRLLSIENCVFLGSGGIAVANGTRSHTDIKDVFIAGNINGVHVTRPHLITDPPGFAIATAKNLQVEILGDHVGFALTTSDPSSGTVTNSLFVSYGYPTSLVTMQADLNLDDSVLLHSWVPFSSGSPGDQTRLSENLIMNHSNGAGSAYTFSYGDNAVAGILQGGLNASPIGFQ